MSACCTIPPVQAEYTPKGAFSTHAGLNTYIVGPDDTGKALLCVYDIFGFSPQILQGADLLGAAGYRVFMPDFLVGKYALGSWFNGTEEGNKKRAEYFSQFPGAFSTQSEPVSKAIRDIIAAGYSVGAVGFCWGWKATVLAEAVNELKALASVTPAFPAAEDAEKLEIPVALLPSRDEDKTSMETLYDALESARPGQNMLKYYYDQQHGFAGARGDLSGGAATDAFRDCYVTLANWFATRL